MALIQITDRHFLSYIILINNNLPTTAILVRPIFSFSPVARSAHPSATCPGHHGRAWQPSRPRPRPLNKKGEYLVVPRRGRGRRGRQEWAAVSRARLPGWTRHRQERLEMDAIITRSGVEAPIM